VDVLGYLVEDWLEGDFWVEHLYAEDRVEAVAFRQLAISRGGSHQCEYRMIAADGTAVWLHEVLRVAVRDGVAETLSGFLIDVTPRRNAEDKARDTFQQLARVNRAASLGEMAATIAHEVNQPLFAIVSNAQTAGRLLGRENPEIAEVSDALNDIVSDGNRAARIVEGIRARVRKESRPAEQLDLSRVAAEVAEFVRADVRQRDLTLTTDLADDLPPIQGNSIDLQQVILNLILNGAQAMRDVVGGSRELALETHVQDGYVVLAVQDHGCGFDEAQADQLFEPFFTTKVHGTGMGLAINRTIILAHGGRIWATSNKDGGATFHFCLPALKEARV